MNIELKEAVKRLERACTAGMDEEYRDDVLAVLGALDARQPVGVEPDAYQLWNTVTERWQEVSKEAYDQLVEHEEEGVRLLYTAPPAPAAVPVELAKFRDAVLHAYGIATDARFEKQLGELLDLIESRFQKAKQEVFVCTGDEIRCHDGNGCECAMRGLMNKQREVHP